MGANARQLAVRMGYCRRCQQRAEDVPAQSRLGTEVARCLGSAQSPCVLQRKLGLVALARGVSIRSRIASTSNRIGQNNGNFGCVVPFDKTSSHRSIPSPALLANINLYSSTPLLFFTLSGVPHWYGGLVLLVSRSW